MKMRVDNGPAYMEWPHREGEITKRVWIKHRTGEEDWAGCGRYIQIGNWQHGRLIGFPQDFPIYHTEDEMADTHIIAAVAIMLESIGGRK